MTRDLRIRHFQGRKAFKQRLAETMALLRVELDAEDMAAADPARKHSAVIRRRPDIVVAVAAKPIAVREIETLLIAIGGQQRVVPHRLDDVPSHVRYPHALLAGLQPHDIGRDDAETWQAALLA